jgi:hypothetical protein
MEPLSSGEISSGENESCVSRIVNTIGLQTIGATPDLQTAKKQIKDLVEAFPAEDGVFRRDSERIVVKGSPVGRAIELILELSADAHIRRREFARDSRAFHTATGAISAYGRVLSLLSKFLGRTVHADLPCGPARR